MSKFKEFINFWNKSFTELHQEELNKLYKKLQVGTLIEN